MNYWLNTANLRQFGVIGMRDLLELSNINKITDELYNYEERIASFMEIVIVE